MKEMSDVNIIENLVYENSEYRSGRFLSFLLGCFNHLPLPFNIKLVPRYRNMMMTHEAMQNISLLLSSVLDNRLKGDVVEFGCHEGLTSILLSKVLEKHKVSKKLYLYDSFNGLEDFSNQDQGIFMSIGDCRSNASKVKYNFRKFKAGRPEIIEGNVLDTIPGKLPDKICFAHLDMDLYTPTIHVLKYLYPKLVKGAVVVLDDYGHPEIPGVKRAVKKYFSSEKFADRIVFCLQAGKYPQWFPGFSSKSRTGKQNLRKFHAYFKK